MNMTWARATQNDMEAACRLNQILDSMSRGEYPATLNEIEEDSVPRYFDEDRMPHLRALYDRIQGTLESAPGYQAWILGAMCSAILFPGNKLLDPDSDIIAKHPKIIQGLADTDRLLWVLSELPGDVLRALVGVVGATADVTELRQRIDTRMVSVQGVNQLLEGDAGEPDGAGLPIPQVVAFDGDWHWVRRTDMPNAASRWVPAQRERGHWNSAAWSGIPMSQIEVGPKLDHGGSADATPVQRDNVIHLAPAKMAASGREIWMECLRTKMAPKVQTARIPNRLLNQGQVEAIYGALCCLNNVALSDSPLSIEFHDDVSGEPCRVQVSNTKTGLVRLSIGGGLLASEREEFDSQDAFCAAYGLDR